MFNNSISGSSAILGGTVWLWPKNITWSGYLTVVKSTEVWRSYYNTLWYTGVGTAINVSITLMVGYPLSRRAFRGRRLLMFYIAFTMWFSGGIIPTFIIVRDLGLYATRWAMVLPTAAAAWNAEQHRRLDPGVGQDRRRHRCRARSSPATCCSTRWRTGTPTSSL